MGFNTTLSSSPLPLAPAHHTAHSQHARRGRVPIGLGWCGGQPLRDIRARDRGF